MTFDLKSTRARGLPISLSRWTDVAHWYMPWLKDILTTGKPFFATDPKSLTLGMWDSSPDEVHSLYFWTKYPPKLTEALTTWLAPWRVFVALTITGWEDVETRVPPLQEQVKAAEGLVQVLGADRLRWRYSPVPCDFAYNTARQLQFSQLCCQMRALGIEEVDVSLLQPSPHWSQGYALGSGDAQAERGTRVEVLGRLVELAAWHGLRVGVCADDLTLLAQLDEDAAAHCFSTSCVDRARLDRVFGLETPALAENGCTCQLSIDPCHGKQFGCASACEYCYVPFTKVPSSK